MKRTLKFLGFGLLVTAVLALAIGGTALAADRVQQKEQLRDGSCEVCSCDGRQLRDGSCSDCTGDQLRLGNGEGPHGKCSAK